MKRTILFLSVLALCAMLLACAAPETETRELVAVSAPEECDVSLMLPFGNRSDATKLLKGYTDGFVSGSGKLLTFTTETENPDIALSSLFEDGTLCILALREGKTTVTVTAVNETGESAVGRVSVTVRSARRIAVLAILGVLVVGLLIAFGQPVKKQPEPEADVLPQETDEVQNQQPIEASEEIKETEQVERSPES